jgi:predicted component of type VI protein secretion system
VHKITGNIPLTARCLESIIEESVEAHFSRVRISYTDENETKPNGKVVLGSAALGVDFICGDAIENDVVNLEFIIGPLQNTEAIDYLQMGSVQRFLDCFYSYFVPVEYQVKTKVLVSKTNQNFLLESMLEGPVLGYETCL